MNRQETINAIISRLSGLCDDALFDFVNNVDNELNNELLGNKRLHSMDTDFSDFYIGRESAVIIADLLDGYDADTGHGFDTTRLYFGYDESGCLYSTDNFTYRDFITDDLAKKIIDNYGALEYYLPHNICRVIESMN